MGADWEMLDASALSLEDDGDDLEEVEHVLPGEELGEGGGL